MPRYGFATAFVALLLSVVACSPTFRGSPTTTPSPSPSPSLTTIPVETPTSTPTVTTPTWKAEQQAAVAAVENWFVIYNQVLRGERHPNDLALAAREEALGDAQKTYNQFGMAKLTAKGEVAVSNLTPSDLISGDRQAVHVGFCQDLTDWQVLDEDGKDTLELKSKTVQPLTATVENWPKDGWFVTALTKGDQKC